MRRELQQDRESHSTFWVAHASRVPVSVPRRNELSLDFAAIEQIPAVEKVRDREDALASMRDACATQNRFIALPHGSAEDD